MGIGSISTIIKTVDGKMLLHLLVAPGYYNGLLSVILMFNQWVKYDGKKKQHASNRQLYTSLSRYHSMQLHSFHV